MAIIPKGSEPENVKARIDTLISKLNEAYPDHEIVGLDNNHKKWAETALEISRLLGYENKNEFLVAYGFAIKKGKVGRPTQSFDAIEELKKRYADGAVFYKISDLINANPDLSDKMKTLSNKANSLYGMTLGRYLVEIGVLLPHELKQKKIEHVKREKKYLFIWAELFKSRIQNQYSSSRNDIAIGDIVEVAVSDGTAFAQVIALEEVTESELTLKHQAIPSILRRVSEKEYKEFIYNRTHSVKKIIPLNALINDAVDAAKMADDNYFISWAVIKGSTSVVSEVYEYLAEKESGYEQKVYDRDNIASFSNGMMEMLVFGEDVQDVISSFPYIKAAMFIEHQLQHEVYFAYSRIGTMEIQLGDRIGSCDVSDPTRWSMMYSPTEDFIYEEESIDYHFPMREDW